jgi:hypothetical protein
MPRTSPPEENESPSAVQRSADGIGRRDVLKATAALGAGAVAPSWLTSPETAEAVAAGRPRSRHRILQPGEGPRPWKNIPATLEPIRWGRLPDRLSKPIEAVRSDTRGDLRHGVARGHPRGPGVAIRWRTSRARAFPPVTCCMTRGRSPVRICHTTSRTTGRISSSGPWRSRARCPETCFGSTSCDSFRACRTPSSRTGTAPGRSLASIRRGRRRNPAAGPQRPELYRNVSILTPLRRRRGTEVMVLPVQRRRRAEFPHRPFLGTMGEALDTDQSTSSVPPSDAGGS